MAPSQVAIVTGGSRGIGAAISKRLAADGYSVLIDYVSNHEAANAIVAEITTQGGKAVAMAADISEPSTSRALFDRAEAEFGEVRVLVNNAGVGFHRWTNLAEADDDTFEHITAVNLKGTFMMLREAAARISENGRIVNITSSLVHAPLPGLSVYAASKAAIQTLSTTLAKELRGRNITVNCIAPGATATEVFLQGKSDELIQSFAEKSPLERLGTPEDIANCVAFLVGPDGGWVNGQVIRLNGGTV